YSLISGFNCKTVFKRPLVGYSALEGPNECITSVIGPAALNAHVFNYASSTGTPAKLRIRKRSVAYLTKSDDRHCHLGTPAALSTCKKKNSSGSCLPLLSGFVPSPRYFA